MRTKESYITASDAFAKWRNNVLKGEPPVLWPVGSGGLAQLEIGPGLVTLIGGAPGAGKSAITMQLLTDALRLTPTLRALVCNIEMPTAVLLDRQLSRFSGVDLSTVRHRRFTKKHSDRLDQGLATMEKIADRLAFCYPPFNLANVAASADAFEADMLVLDYIQRIPPPGEYGDKRGSVDATMSYLRQFADAEVAVLVVSSVSRGKDSRGRSSYAGDALTLASYRESSELEFGADDAFILAPGGKKDSDQVTLRHLKSRNGECRDLKLTFDRHHQSFTTNAGTPEGNGAGKFKESKASQ